MVCREAMRRTAILLLAQSGLGVPEHVQDLTKLLLPCNVGFGFHQKTTTQENHPEHQEFEFDVYSLEKGLHDPLPGLARRTCKLDVASTRMKGSENTERIEVRR